MERMFVHVSLMSASSPCLHVLMCRNVAKQAFLETLQDYPIEMDILGPARREAAPYNDGHFLFKPGGTSPMYCTTSPGYPLTSSTVYSPPPRPLPRNTFSRPAFGLKKPYKHCNWKCAALSAILTSVTLVFLLAYFIGESTSPLLSSPFLSSPHLTSPLLSSPLLSSPLHSSPLLSSASSFFPFPPFFSSPPPARRPHSPPLLSPPYPFPSHLSLPLSTCPTLPSTPCPPLSTATVKRLWSIIFSLLSL
ncbi:unnamed protein product [Oncorhynchus mykiss]|uniref:Teneurin N-terminal domain-containing protein n=1 Tax=Oncorhynchus mykiss TaxID=8022 RepID=A0A060Z3R4_ONCMY|nr:unnamed protein product [Oncorhynchus mykiss]